jgi:diguanylate cyclase (GGDEF)-like protein/PAS domain S-box-containing protein
MLTLENTTPAEEGVTGLSTLLEGTASMLRAVTRFRPEEDFIRYALDNSAIVAVTDVRGTITYVNGTFCEISGYTRDELIGSNHRMLKSGLHDTDFFRTMYREIAQGRIWHGEICNRRKDGSLYWVDTTIVPHISEQGKADSYTSIRFDITARKQLEVELRASKEHLKHLANHDPLTDLPNRRCFQEFVEATVARHARTGRSFHLALLDVDTFKEINDSFGHHAGDQLLQTVAARLTAHCPRGGFISRLGGDEFGIILSDVSPTAAATILEEVLQSLRQPIEIGATVRRCSASLGVAAFPRDGRNSEALMKAADLALYHAKALGRDRYELFQPVLREAAERRSEMLVEIEDGLRRDSFLLHYQPIVPSGSGPVSLEALMRWRHPQRGLLAPGAFQEGFSDPAVRAALGLFMLERVFQDLSRLPARDLPLGRVAMNLTNSDFRSEAFIDRFFALCAETEIGPRHFSVEVTEGMFLGSHQKRVEDGLQRLHEAGVEIALDDFGTGYASLTHLRQLPLDRLKIDRSFVANMAFSREDRAIVRGIIDIAHSLGKLVTAEGVETLEQVDLLCAMGCDHLQGWHFGKACPPERLLAMLSSLHHRRLG